MARILSLRAAVQIERLLGKLAGAVDGIAVLASDDGEALASSSEDRAVSHAIAREAVTRGVDPAIQVHWVAADAALIVSSHPAIACGLVHQRAARAVDILRLMIVRGRGAAPSGNDPFSGAPAQVGLAKRLS